MSAAAAGRLVVPPHWRPEVSDIARTMVDASSSDASDAAPRVVVGRRAAWLAAAGGGAATAWLLSDAKTPRSARLAMARQARSRVFRLWWNGADEISDALATMPAGARRGTHLCFFREVEADLASDHPDLDVVRVPYAFASPRPGKHAPTEPRIAYTSEVDISDGCFGGLGLDDTEAEALSARAWELAEQVVDGQLTLVGADGVLRSASTEDERSYRVTLWAVRNRVRYLLLKAIAEAFPGRLALRGSDWRALGFAARRTSFRRRVRMADYRRFRVSLDLGSKSTHAALYPRTADVLSVAGGIVQFDSGDPAVDGSPLRARQAASLPALLGLVDRLLSDGEEDVVAENRGIAEWYAGVRLASGRQLLREVARRMA